MAAYILHKFLKPDAVEDRPFQSALAKSAQAHQNTLIVAPTALGKTVVAALVIAMELEKNPSARILFLSPTKPLAQQHHLSMQKLLALPEEKFALLTGSTTTQKRLEMAAHAQFISATPQTVQSDLLVQKKLPPDFDLIVFDEAHRAVGDYAYVDLARFFKEKTKARFLALTASPGGTEEKIQTVCKNLFIDHVEIKRSQDAEVREFVNAIDSEWRLVELPPVFKPILKNMEAFMVEQLESLRKMGLVPTTNLKYFSRKRQLELQASIRKRIISHGKTQPSLFAAASKSAAMLKIAHAHTLLETQGVESLGKYFEKMKAEAGTAGASKAVKQIIGHDQIIQAMNGTRLLAGQGLDHPKKIVLANLLADQFQAHPESRVIVFSQYRDQINTLVSFINAIEGIRAKKFIGQADRESDEGMNQKEQLSTIEALRAGEFNTLVASSVAEEGLDIPSVDLVVFFEPVPSEIRTIQRRGRTGRWGKGRLITLVTKGTRDEAFYYVAKSKERLMHATLTSIAGEKSPIARWQPGQKTVEVEEEEEIAIGPEQKMDKIKDEPPSQPKKEGQTTLDGFSGEKDEIIIYVDWREQNSRVTRALARTECTIRFKQLDIGDYILSSTVAVERKTIDDFLQSMIDGRLFEQIQRLSNTYARPFLILEGEPAGLFTKRNIHPNAIMGCLTTIAVRYRLPVIYADSPEQTADFLLVTAKREQSDKEKDFRLRTGKKGHTLAERQQFVVESLPNVGPRLARSLLRHFGTIRNLVNARFEDLQNVEQMGEKKAKRILRVLRAHYEEDSKKKEKDGAKTELDKPPETAFDENEPAGKSGENNQ